MSTTGGLRPQVSPAEAATAAWRFVRREPRTVLVWAGVFLLFNLAWTALILATAGPAYFALAAPRAAGLAPDPAAMFTTLARAAPAFAVGAVAFLALYAVFYAAVNRVLLRLAEGGWFHLKLGADELRQAGVLVLSVLVFLGAYLLMAVAGAILFGLGAVAGRAAGGAAGAAVYLLIGLCAFAAVLGGLAFLVFLGVRLSLASALTFDTGRVRMFGSWPLTRGVFWSLFGTYLLALVFMALLVLAQVVVTALVAAVTGAGGGGFNPGAVVARAGPFSAAGVANLVITALIYPPYLLLLVGAPAAAYAQIVASGGWTAGSRLADRRAEVFGPTA